MSGMVLLLAVMIGATLPGVVRRMMPPLPPAELDGAPQAVVVLGAGRQRRGGSYQVPASGLRRAGAGMQLARELDLPLLISGGCADGHGPSEAALMLEALQHRWPQANPWLEEQSRTTWENARYSAALLREQGVRRIVLVTDRVHLCRAVLSFQAQGLEVAPHAATETPSPEWMPSAGALALIPEIYYEWAALVVYRLRYF